MKQELETKRLILRPWTLDPQDIKDAYDIWSNPKVLYFIGDPPFASMEVATTTIKGAVEKHGKNNVYRWATVYRETGKIIAGCGLHPFEDSDDLELVYHFAENYWGKGLASEAAEACINFAKKNKLASKLIGVTHPENIASQRVLEKFGFVYKEIYEEDKLHELLIER